jgi:hypothetical protein
MNVNTEKAIDYAKQHCGFAMDGAAKTHLIHMIGEHKDLLAATENLVNHLKDEIAVKPTANRMMAQEAIDDVLLFFPNARDQESPGRNLNQQPKP